MKAGYTILPALLIFIGSLECDSNTSLSYDSADEQMNDAIGPPALEEHMEDMGYSTIDTFIVTAYLAIDEYENRFHGITYSGVPAKPYHTVAVDPRVVPLGAWLYIENLGWYRAEDTGNMIKGKRLDICVETRPEAMEWGKRKMQVWFLSPEQFERADEQAEVAIDNAEAGNTG